MNFYMPVKLYSGVNIVSEKKDEFLKLGKKCLIITSSSAAKKCGALDDVTAALDEVGIQWMIFDKVSANPLLTLCMEAGKAAHEFSADFIIGIGGGSPMDAAKASAVFASNPEMTEDEFYSMTWPNTPAKIALVGTTSGTGSEVTNVAVLTDSKCRKHSIHENRMYASVSFGDPRYTMSLPLNVTLSTGIDVLAHCAESYFSKKANEISRAFSVRGIKLLLPALKKAIAGDSLDINDRQTLYEASLLGGLAISVTGTVFPHNVGYYLTENYGVPHGIACAVFLPDLLKHIKLADSAFAEIFYSEIDSSYDELLFVINNSLPELNISMSSDEIEKALPRWENNNSVKNTFGTVSVSDIKVILTDKFLN